MKLHPTTLPSLPTATTHIEEAHESGQVDIQASSSPYGVPLHPLVAAVQKEVPGVNGMHRRGATLTLSHAAPPSAEDRERIAWVLSDVALHRAARVSSSSVPDHSDMLEALRDAATSDADWLRTFRQYAVTVLLADRT